MEASHVSCRSVDLLTTCRQPRLKSSDEISSLQLAKKPPVPSDETTGIMGLKCYNTFSIHKGVCKIQ